MSSRGAPDNGLGNRGSPFDRGNNGANYIARDQRSNDKICFADHGHPDGRMSNASTMFSDPGYRYTDIQVGTVIHSDVSSNVMGNELFFSSNGARLVNIVGVLFVVFFSKARLWI